ncbi:MAG: TIGR01212 family radical SAM protein [Marinilabiliales bacterium]|nr:MAG: TIGR01212 family radical SAM protein [Marinilabiliales bacterium]
MHSNENYIWGHNRRFNAYVEYFKKEFGGRVQKVAIDAGYTCPNRDGSKSYGGCTYCVNKAFNPSYCDSEKSISQQITEGIDFHKFRYRRAKQFIAYFQAFSNTYAPVDELKRKYNEALSHPEVIGLVIGTRPDCIDEKTLELLAEISEKHYLILEFGIESCYNKTLERINRQHSFEETIKALELAKSFNIKTGGHIIFGLPGESRQEMLDEANILSKLHISNLKFHQLQIFKGTVMEKQFHENPEDFKLFSLEEYLNFFIDFLEQLNPEIIIERFTGEAPPRFLAGPSWGKIRSDEILRMFEHKLEERNTWQGKYYKH